MCLTRLARIKVGPHIRAENSSPLSEELFRRVEMSMDDSAAKDISEYYSHAPSFCSPFRFFPAVRRLFAPLDRCAHSHSLSFSAPQRRPPSPFLPLSRHSSMNKTRLPAREWGKAHKLCLKTFCKFFSYRRTEDRATLATSRFALRPLCAPFSISHKTNGFSPLLHSI